MKKNAYLITAVIITIAALWFTYYQSQPREEQIQGHSYIVVRAPYHSSIIHAEHCQCKGGGK